MMASEGLHEETKALSPETMDRHRAIVSLMEELEAVDWYDQRVDAATDEELREILAHNRYEEKEHAAMVLEWLRRKDPRLDQELRDYLFSAGSITGHEEHVTGGGTEEAGPDGDGGGAQTPARSLGIGSLKGRGM